MQIDKEWLSRWFAEFNRQYFSGSLPTPHLATGMSRTQLGTMSYKRKMKFGKTEYHDFTIRLSNYYDQSEEQFKNVLLHEMIHLYIACSGHKDSSPHGVIFCQMMQHLNQLGWNISISTKTNSLENNKKATPNSKKTYLVLALKTTDGRHFLSSVNPRYARSLQKDLSRVKELESHQWYITDNRWFENMPCVRSLRGRSVSEEEFSKLIATMELFNF